MRCVLAGLLVLCGAAAAQAEDGTVFPGPVTELKSPAGDLSLTYSDPGENEFGGHDYSLRLVYPDGHSDEIVVFTRTVHVAWSPAGTALSVTNIVGADTADCYVVTTSATGISRISLTDVVTSGRFPAPAWALQHSAHGNVTCDGWVAADQLRFVLEGAGGDSPNGFRYAFVYDLTRGQAKQVGAGKAAVKSAPAKPASPVKPAKKKKRSRS